MNVSTESLIKTIIVFKDGLVTQLMDTEQAAANALVAFKELGIAMAEGQIGRIKLDVKEPYFQTLLDAFSEWDDENESPVREAANMPEARRCEVVEAFGKLSEKIISADALPVTGGKLGVQRIWDKLKKGE